MKRLLGLMIMFLLINTIGAQQKHILMKIDGEEINCKEYQNFCSKESIPVQAIRPFVDFKLKVHAAKQLKLDTLKTIRDNLEAFRILLSQRYLLSQKGVDSLAFNRYKSQTNSKHTERVYVSHIFLHIPQNVTSNRLNTCMAFMDSINGKILTGNLSFDRAVELYSEEKEPFWIQSLQMPAEFEEIAFTLPTGQISRPFLTPQGIHILKVLQKEEIPAYEVVKDQLFREAIQCPLPHIVQSQVDSLKTRYNFQIDKTGMSDFLKNGATDKNLFALDGKTYSGHDLALFTQAHPSLPQRQLEEFITKTVLDYAYLKLHTDSSNFTLVLRSYQDSLLCQAITKHWRNEILTDTSGVKSFFKHNIKKYRWSHERYEGIVLHSTTKRIGKKVKKFLKKLPVSEWEEAIRLGVNTNGKTVVRIEKGLFSLGDNDYIDDLVFKKGTSQPMANFPYVSVLGKKKKGPEHWTEVGNILWEDYLRDQQEIWLRQLHHTAKVEINEEVLKTVNNH